MLNPVLPLAEKDEHMQRVAERHAFLDSPPGQAMLQDRVTRMSQRGATAEQRVAFVRHARDAKSASKRIMWLRREADSVSPGVEGNAACHAGCSHCCHIGVTLSETEARVIAAETGRPMAQPPAERVISGTDVIATGSADEAAKVMKKARQWAVDQYFGVPCTFLVDDKCSIYKHRPLVCRMQVNVDIDALLCRLAPGNEQSDKIAVPYVDRRESQMAQVMVLGAYVRMADIRDWFPN